MVGPRRTAVVTDDAAALPPAWREAAAREGGLAVVELPVLVDGRPLPAPGDGTPQELLRAVAEGRPVTTSRPSPGRLRRAYQQFQDAGYDGIVSVHLSGELSGTAGSARIARQGVDVPVTVVDSRTAAMAQGLGVQSAWRAAGTGADGEQVAAAAREGSRDAALLLWVPSLEPLRRGGRIGPGAPDALPQPGSLLSVSGGRLVPAGTPGAPARARFGALVGAALAAAEPRDPVLVMHHLGDGPAARELGEELVAAHRPGARLVVCPLPPVLAAHVGPGACAAVVERHRLPALPPSVARRR
ncbi:MAG TPA: DegV family protein [Kocuria rosea]|nr:DegV family protein [Kocuria rosea]